MHDYDSMWETNFIAFLLVSELSLAWQLACPEPG